MKVRARRTVVLLVWWGVSVPLVPLDARAQHAEGIVRDVTGPPISHVYVALLDERQRVVAATLTEEDGSFLVAAPRPGNYYIRVARIGYVTLFDGTYHLSVRDPLEASVVMHPLPVETDPVTVTVSGRVARLTDVGFYGRQETGFGYFIEREEILRTAAAGHLVDVLRRIPRVHVAEERPGELNPGLFFRGGASGFCRPTIYLDGTVVTQGGRGAPARPDDWVVPEDVEAVEIYTGPASVPLRFQALARCGVVMIWTRHTPLGR